MNDTIESLKKQLNEEFKLRSSLMKEKEHLEHLIASESVYTLLRYGVKNPSSSGVDECEPERHYYELYNISTELMKLHK